MPAPRDGLPFVFDVEDAFQLTARGTVIMGVIEQGAVCVGDHLELIPPGSGSTAPPLRFQCRGVDAPRITGHDPALGTLVGIFTGLDIEPDAIRAGAKLRAATDNEVE
jgi:translation elongation factor EF-Tu-like GTPase